MTTFPASTLHRVTSTCGRHLCLNRLPRNCCRMPWGAARSTIRWPKPSSWMSPSPLTRREHSWNLHSPIGIIGNNSLVLEVHMTRRTIGLISIVLVLVIGLGALIAVPAVRADTTAPVSAADKAATDAKLAALKTLGQQVREAAKAVQEKVKAAKAAGKDLSAFKAGIATALKSGRNLRFNVARMRKPQLTAAERTQLKAVEVRARELKKQLKAKIDAKAPQAEIDALKAQLKLIIAEREALVKAFRLRARTQMLVRLDNLIAGATRELGVLNGLLATLP